MKIIYLLPFLVSLYSCTNKQTQSNFNNENEPQHEKVVNEFQTILDSASITGSILIYDLGTGKYYSNDFERSRKGFLPASTYKIPNSIIALETGVVDNENSVFKWDGKKRGLKVWEQDLTLKEAFHLSCVPCYQEVARKIGVKTMNEYLDKFKYGNIKVDSTTIDVFWLEGESSIDQFQQIDFLQRLYQSKLPISQRTESIMKQMMVIEETEQYRISGKTGWSTRQGNDNGWFVGYIEVQDSVYFFATNVEPTIEFEMSSFPKIRQEVTYKALKQMRLIE
ncbi:class D beta-lactamase [Mangrovivirga sp. M17]|uniref:beta-lactamase n=1 Tax=Mangrovivirga halotolerans TaxID=2993936 RepID=A0ABT3RP09_9BACT|nr:class D beta-lactamase [Mangrovivirga halotolerans]MCX2743340.1 class D beta-lactamase [Mangrovivirga halotolerans]